MSSHRRNERDCQAGAREARKLGEPWKRHDLSGTRARVNNSRR